MQENSFVLPASNSEDMKTVCFVGVVILLAGYVSTKSLPLPSYLTACWRYDPDFAACATKAGQAGIEHIVKGDRKYKIPVLDPLLITRLHVDEAGLGLNFTATDIKLMGLKNTKVKLIKWDTKTKKGVYSLEIPRVEIDAQYEITGRILVLPITGNGRANITLLDVTTVYNFEFDLVKKADGLEYFRPTKSDLIFDTSRMYMKLENLFNGNELLGVEMNKFMDENWRELVKAFGPAISNAVGEVMRRIQFNVFDLVSHESAVPDKPI